MLILWSDDKGDDVRMAPCSNGGLDDPFCAEISIRQAGREIKRTDKAFLTQGIAIEWRRPSGANGPDVVVTGTGGGSLGDLDVLSLTFGPATSIQEFEIDHAYPTQFRLIDDAPTFDLTFSVLDFGAESNAETAASPVSMHWANAKFDVDFAALALSGPSNKELSDMRFELLHSPRTLQSHLAKTVQVLLKMILAGKADQAKRTLDADWTGDIVLREEVWSRLCSLMVADHLWRDLGLDRLKGADFIKAAAVRYPGASSAH